MRNHTQRKLRIYIIATVFGLLISGALLALLALVMWIMQMPVSIGAGLGQVCFGAGCLSAGIVTGRIRHSGGLGGGLCSAMLLFLLISLISLITGGFDAKILLGRIVVAIICGCVGGVIGVNQERKI